MQTGYDIFFFRHDEGNDGDGDGDDEGEVEERVQQDERLRRGKEAAAASGSIPSSSSSESVGPDEPIDSPSRRAHQTIQEQVDDDDDEEEELEPEQEQHEEEEDDDDDDADHLGCPLVRTYIGGPVKPQKRVLIHLSHQSAISANATEIPLDREGEEEANASQGGGGVGDGGRRGTKSAVYVQQDQDTDEYMEEIKVSDGHALADK